MTPNQPTTIAEVEALVARLGDVNSPIGPQEMLDLRRIALNQGDLPKPLYMNLLRLAVERLRNSRTAMSGTAKTRAKKAKPAAMTMDELNDLI